MRGGSDSPDSCFRSGTTSGLSATGVIPSYYDLFDLLWLQEGENTDDHVEIRVNPRVDYALREESTRDAPLQRGSLSVAALTKSKVASPQANICKRLNPHPSGPRLNRT
jgi:hypothetical protein